MRIALDGLAFGNRGGTGRYVEMLVTGLIEILKDTDRLLILVRDDVDIPSSWNTDSRLTLERVSLSGLAWRSGLFQVRRRHRYLNSWLNRMAEEGVDLFHGPAFVLPRIPSGVVSVVTVHDLAFRLYPETLPRLRRWYLDRAVPNTIRRADLVLADCDAVRDQIHSEFGAELPVSTVLLGVPRPRPLRPGADKHIRARYSLGDRYWLTLSTLEPRKNLIRLLDAYRAALEVTTLPPLVLAGRRGWGCRLLDRMLAAPSLRERVVCTGFVSDEERDALLACAELFLAPSFYEGCDLPAIEAAARGTPVAAADIPPHRQYLPESTCFINPYDIAAWTGRLIEWGTDLPDRRSPSAIREPVAAARDAYAAYESALRASRV